MTRDWNEIEGKKNRTLSRPIRNFGLESCKFIFLNPDGVACAREKTFLNLIISVRSKSGRGLFTDILSLMENFPDHSRRPCLVN